MSAKSDSFVVAMYALWAGDFKLAERVLSESGGLSGTVGGNDGFAEQFMARVAKTRLGQLRRRREEFENLSAGYDDRTADQPLRSEPEVLETTHMRATVWR